MDPLDEWQTGVSFNWRYQTKHSSGLSSPYPDFRRVVRQRPPLLRDRYAFDCLLLA